jgi:hypothetical protein
LARQKGNSAIKSKWMFDERGRQLRRPNCFAKLQ